MVSIADLKSPPHNTEAEKSLLSCIFIDNDVFYISDGEGLNEYDFHSQINGRIYEVMSKLKKSMIIIDPTTVSSELDKKGFLEFCGGIDYLYDLNSYMFSTSGGLAYTKMIKEASMYRNWIKDAQNIISKSMDMQPAEEILSSIKKMSEIKNGSKPGIDSLDAITDYVMNIGQTSNKICSYGFKNFDAVVDGYKKGQLIIVAGRPGMGKTLVMLNMSDNINEQGFKSAMFSLEMTRVEISERMISKRTGIPANKLSTSTDKIEEIVNIATEKVKEGLFTIYDHTNSFNDIVNEIRRRKLTEGLDVVFIDYLGLIRNNEKSFSKDDAIGKITAELKRVAIQYGVCIVLGCQLSRHSARDQKRPGLTDLRDSGNIEQDADNVYLLYRGDFNEDERWKTRIEIIIAKQRIGGIGSVLLGIEPKSMALSDVDQGELEYLN